MAQGGACSHQWDLRRASHRVQTFIGWPFSTSQRPEKLAAEGFVYTGKENIIQCHFCGLSLLAGKSTWNPAEVHSQRTAGKCWFANKRMQNRMNSSLAPSSLYGDSMGHRSGFPSVLYARERPTKGSKGDLDDASAVSGTISYDKNKQTLKERQLAQRVYVPNRVAVNGVSHTREKREAEYQRVPVDGKSYHSFMSSTKNAIPETHFKEDMEDKKGHKPGVDRREKLDRNSIQMKRLGKRQTEVLAAQHDSSDLDEQNIRFDHAGKKDDFNVRSRRDASMINSGNPRRQAYAGYFRSTMEGQAEAAKQPENQGTGTGVERTEQKSDETAPSPRKEEVSQGPGEKKEGEVPGREMEALVPYDIHPTLLMDQLSVGPEDYYYNPFVKAQDLNASAVLVMIDQGYYKFQRDSKLPMKYYVNAAMDLEVVCLAKAQFSSSLVRKVILEGLEKGEEYFTCAKRLVEAIYAYIDAHTCPR